MSIFITAFGETLSSKEWASRYGINEYTIVRRFYRGWPPEEAVSVPVQRSETGWRAEWTEVLEGAASDEYASETAERLGWPVSRVNSCRRGAEAHLGMRTLAGAVTKAITSGIIKVRSEPSE